MKKILAAAVAATLAFSADAAITVTGSYTSDANSFATSSATSAGQVLFDFSNPTLSGTANGFTLSNTNTPGLFGIGAFTGASVVSGSNTVGNGYSAPTNDSTNYLAIFQNGAQTIANTATGYNTLSLYWGSPDAFNTITFLDQTGASLGSITASSVAGLTSLTESALVTLNASQNFYGVSLSSSSNSFELDNVKFSSTTAAVPEPASWAMMIGGFGLVGFAMRRRHSRTAHHVLG